MNRDSNVWAAAFVMSLGHADERDKRIWDLVKLKRHEAPPKHESEPTPAAYREVALFRACEQLVLKQAIEEADYVEKLMSRWVDKENSLP